MTIQEAIDMVDRLKPNQYDFNTKVGWLAKLDGMIFKEVILTHAGIHPLVFGGYDNAPPQTKLIVPYPYDEDVYNYFLQSQIDKENGEIGKYNQSATLYNNAYKSFCDYWNRTHMPLPLRSHFVI